MKIIRQKTKTLTTRDNGRSSDAVSPNFIYGCLGGCMNSYCYVGRHNYDRVYVNENTTQILASVSNWVSKQPWPKTPNQCDDKYYTIDIGCSTDVFPPPIIICKTVSLFLSKLSMNVFIFSTIHSHVVLTWE
mgnify:CR=1 FL=1